MKPKRTSYSVLQEKPLETSDAPRVCLKHLYPKRLGYVAKKGRGATFRNWVFSLFCINGHVLL